MSDNICIYLCIFTCTMYIYVEIFVYVCIVNSAAALLLWMNANRCICYDVLYSWYIYTYTYICMCSGIANMELTQEGGAMSKLHFFEVAVLSNLVPAEVMHICEYMIYYMIYICMIYMDKQVYVLNLLCTKLLLLITRAARLTRRLRGFRPFAASRLPRSRPCYRES